ncbi:hypothetical protein MMC18_006727 [Xylographa bjoerkii]|nr:hypothetical protein [Xylographa bjoerkii]
MATTEEGTHKLPDGKELYTKTWKAGLPLPFLSLITPAGPPIAIVIFLHGFSDHCTHFDEFFIQLSESGVLAHGFDQRGWGRSVRKPSDKGRSGPTSRVIADISSVIESKLPSSVPVFLMGHSMGGQETLIYASTGPAEIRKQISGYVAVAPFIRLHPSSQPNTFTVIAGRLACKILPNMQLVQKLDVKYMSHDLAVCKSYEEDKLCHDTGTLEGMEGMLDRADALDKGKVDLEQNTHLWIGHGTDDLVINYEGTKEFFDRSKSKDKTLKLYEGAYHCIQAESEPYKSKFFADLTEWILAQAGSKGGLAPEGQSQSRL